MNPDTTLDPALVELMRSAPSASEIVDGILTGFSGELANEILLSKPKREQFLRLVVAIAPGEGWVQAALTRGKKGDVNRQLLSLARSQRDASQWGHLLLTEDAEGVTVTPPWVATTSADAVATAWLTGGAVLSWNAADLGLSPMLQTTRKQLASLTEEFYPPGTLLGLQTEGTYPVDPAELSAHPLSRLALAQWLERSHPSTLGSQAPFDEELLRLEWGIAAHANADLIGPGEAGVLLDGVVPALERASLLSRVWQGWRADLARGVVAAGIDALRATHPDQLSDSLLNVTEGIEPDEEALAYLAGTPLTRPEELALAAGSDIASDDPQEGVRIVIDPRVVPPRSVSAEAQNARYRLTNGELEILVEAGDWPVESLIADVWFGETKRTTTLRREGSFYVGFLQLPAGPDDIEIRIYGEGKADVQRTGREVSESIRLVRDLLTARRHLARTLLREGLEITELPDRPFLAEILAWEEED